jgi:hypothetical protein
MWISRTVELKRSIGPRGSFVLGLLLGISAALAAVAEQQALSLSQRVAPLLHPAGITTLEWRLAQVQLSDVEERIDKLTDAGSLDGYCCTSYWYDPTKGKIMARLIYGSDTADRLTVQELSRRLGQAGQGAADRVSAQLKVWDGISIEAKNVEVEFVTGLRIFAIYRDAQLELIDRKLK